MRQPKGYKTYPIIQDYPIIRDVSDVFALPWEKAGIQPLLKVGGVYMLVDKSKLYPYDYIGQAVSIQHRLYWGEEHQVFDLDRHDIYFLRIDDESIRDYIEGTLIRILKPLFNKNNRYAKNVPDEIQKRDLHLTLDEVYGKHEDSSQLELGIIR